jgi:hypothetical protein
MHELLSGIKEKSKSLERLCINYQQQPEKPLDTAPIGETSFQRDLDSYVYIPSITPALVKSLRTLSIPAPCMSIDTLFTLSRLPLLESLAFTGTWTSEVHGDEWLELETSSFPALARLVVPCCSIRAAIQLLSAIPDSTPLGEIDISYSGDDSELPELCATMARFRTSLHSVCLKYVNPGPSPRPLQVALERLAACSRLESLVLDASVELSDAEFGAFLGRFPRMRAVRVGRRHMNF